MEKCCVKCKETKLIEEFYKDSSEGDMKSPYCKECVRMKQHLKKLIMLKQSKEIDKEIANSKKHTKEKPIKKIHNHKLSNSELKFCLKCKESKLSIDFGRDNRQTDNKAIYCRECKNKVSIPPLTKKEIKDKRRRVGKSFMEKRDYLTYGITIEKYDEMFELQKGKCAICEEIQITGKVLAIDHCHTTGKVRGLLCQTCNTGIAMFKDNIKILKMAIKYLELYSI